MSATVEIHGSLAHMSDEGYEWQSDDKSLKKLLNALLDEDGPSGADPHPAGTAAQIAVDRFGGEIIQDNSPPRVKGRIY